MTDFDVSVTLVLIRKSSGYMSISIDVTDFVCKLRFFCTDGIESFCDVRPKLSD